MSRIKETQDVDTIQRMRHHRIYNEEVNSSSTADLINVQIIRTKSILTVTFLPTGNVYLCRNFHKECILDTLVHPQVQGLPI